MTYRPRTDRRHDDDTFSVIMGVLVVIAVYVVFPSLFILWANGLL